MTRPLGHSRLRKPLRPIPRHALPGSNAPRLDPHWAKPHATGCVGPPTRAFASRSKTGGLPCPPPVTRRPPRCAWRASLAWCGLFASKAAVRAAAIHGAAVTAMEQDTGFEPFAEARRSSSRRVGPTHRKWLKWFSSRTGLGTTTLRRVNATARFFRRCRSGSRLSGLRMSYGRRSWPESTTELASVNQRLTRH
jgi:hypothetical protein